MSTAVAAKRRVHLINADLFTCGIASIIQSVGFWKIGVRLPLLQGVTFTAVSPMIAIGLSAGGGTAGLLQIYGAVIVAGLFTFFMAPYFAKLLRFFPPVVAGTVILIIGIALLPVAANDIVDGQTTLALQNPVLLENVAYAMGTLLLIVAVQRVFRGFWVLERAFAQRPFADTIELRSALHDAVMSGDAGEQQHLLDSFADLGGEHEGREDAYVAKIANYRFDDLVADANPIVSARVARYEEADR